jgi:hypothetical protein
MYWSNWGSVNPIGTGSIANQCFDPDTIMISFNVTCSAVSGITIASDHVYVLGAQLLWTPRRTFGAGSRREARLMLNGFRVQEVPTSLDF